MERVDPNWRISTTRSINASAAAAIVMHEWIRTHALRSS
jgi:tRNA G18 (ribose-2'-O)-methylase SpoU